MADKTAQTIYIDADPSTVMDVIADIGSYPDWVAEYKETEVLEVDDEGYPKKARLLLDAAVLKDTMVLDYTGRPTVARSPGSWSRVRCSSRSTAHTGCRPRDPAPTSRTSCRWTWSFR